MNLDKSHPAVKAYLLLIRAVRPLQCAFLLAIRITWGWLFFVAGKGKLGNLSSVAGFFGKIDIPLPYFNAILASCTECFGGMLLLLGLGARLVSVPLTITMVVAYVAADRASLHSLNTFVKAAPFPFLMTSLIVLCFGPGKVSIDYLIQRFVLKKNTGSSKELS